MSDSFSLIIKTDGGSRGNPGQAAVGVVVFKDNDVIAELAATIGVATNNEAEYQAVITALEWLENWEKTEKITNVVWQLDSKLVVEQLNKNWKIKEPRMKIFAQQIWQMLSKFKFSYQFSHIPRSENSAADALVNQALDAAGK